MGTPGGLASGGFRQGDKMLLTKMRNPNMCNDAVNVNNRSYSTDDKGCCAVHPADVPVLRDACGFETVGVIESEQKQTSIRLPETKDEFLDMAFAIGLSASDLHDMAKILEPPTPHVEQQFAEPVTTYVAPPPPDQEKMISVPPDEEQAEEIEVAPQTTEEPEPEPSNGNGNGHSESEEVTISMALSKAALLDIGIKLGLPVKATMSKRKIYNELVLQSQEVDHHGNERQDVQQPSAVGQA